MTGMGRRLSLMMALVFLVGTPRSSAAFSIGSGFTPGCHERITMEAFRRFALDLPTAFIPIPKDPTWQQVADFLLSGAELDDVTTSDAHRFLLTSLLLGVRSPDTDGHSVLNFGNMRKLHSDPEDEGQYAHSLRGLEDDEWLGNRTAVAGTRAIIIERVERGYGVIIGNSDEELVLSPFYLDFYGQVYIDAFGPIYFVGQAAHALQDSFAHTLRSADQRRILHVMNYADAIGHDHNETRDGFAHSDSMDDCTSGPPERVEAAIEATMDLFIAVRARFQARDPGAVNHVLDKWLQLQEEPQCTLANNYCDAPLLSHAREKQSGPYLEKAFGCQQSPHPTPTQSALLLLLGGMTVAFFRGRRSRFDPAKSLASRPIRPHVQVGSRRRWS